MNAQVKQDEIDPLYSYLIQNFPAYAAEVMTVKPNDGGIYIPFKFRRAQKWLHMQLEAQLKEQGLIRALVPKARQLGCSTYIAGRFFHKTANQHGTNTMILTHRSDATDTLFAMVKQFYEDAETNPFDLVMAPELGHSNKKELKFPKLKSGYTVGTEKGTNIGRSMTLQLLHLSEIAFYNNAEDLSSGLMTAVHEQPGTEIIQESTGNGPTGVFYSQCQTALREKNKGPWRVYFLPWSWDLGYTREAPQGFVMPEEFKEYQALHNLTDDQLYWFYLRNHTTATMHGAETDEIFPITKQEYPMSVDECFQHTAETKFFKVANIIAAREAKSRPEEGMPRILGVDPAGDGSDKTYVIDRQGTALGSRINQEIKSSDPNIQADTIVRLVIEHGIHVVVVDVTGLGLALKTLLRMKLPSQVQLISINFANKATNSKEHANKKAELYWNLLVWLMPDPFAQPSIPNDDQLVKEMLAYNWGQGECYRDDRNILRVTAKEKVRAALGGSPDALEASILTTAFKDAYLAKKLKALEKKMATANQS